uniref:Uncharacterized protein n=1 Tax=candidate division CPR3 bacterium TaxID=2268181 RepID=A0A7V3JAD9_UNCC3
MAEEIEEKQPRKTNIKKVALISIALFIFIVSGFFLTQNILRKELPLKPSQPTDERIKIEPPPPPTVENTEEALLRKATLVFPNITSSP